MGTRSLTVMQDENQNEIAVLYRQFDGYPDGHGAELADFLRDFTVVNGFSSQQSAKVANGGDCLAAQIVAYFKIEIGNFYLRAAGTRDMGEEYIYIVQPQKDGTIRLSVLAGSMTFFGLPGTKQENMPLIFDGDVKDFDPSTANEQHVSLAEQDEIPNDFIESQQEEDREDQQQE